MIITLDKAVELLSKGELVAIPTETVYGLAARYTDLQAIISIFVTKGRPSDNPIIVHISNLEQLNLLTDDISDRHKALIDAFWPGPLTLIFNKLPHVFDRITGGLNTVAVRMPSHPIALQLIDKIGPIVAPSANKSGKPSTTRVEHVLHDYSGYISVLDGGICEIGIESTVFDCTSDQVGCLLRPGKISQNDLSDVLGDYEIETPKNGHLAEKLRSPGMKYTHYAPNATVRWMNAFELEGVFQNDTRYLFVHGNFITENPKGYSSNFEVFTKELFDQFRLADDNDEKEIAIEPFSADANLLAPALLNRIHKAMKH